MDFLNLGIPCGRYAGINVRLHFTFFIFAWYQLQGSQNLGMGVAFLIGMYVCILLHEFGHALAARWCDGEATDILLWPLGGLAFVRPAWSPTAHLITTVAGPFVTLVIWLALTALTPLLGHLVAQHRVLALEWPYVLCSGLKRWNLLILLFNLIPAFPMDGGRILRDTLWHWMRAETATLIAVRISQAIAVAAIAWAIWSQQYMLILLAAFILVQAVNERHIVAFEAGGAYGFSLRERLRRGTRQRAFFHGVRDQARQDAAAAFHRCAVCGRTERDDPLLDFRGCSECSQGEEYCPEHLSIHRHV